jgi:hypothetical protein
MKRLLILLAILAMAGSGWAKTWQVCDTCTHHAMSRFPYICDSVANNDTIQFVYIPGQGNRDSILGTEGSTGHGEAQITKNNILITCIGGIDTIEKVCYNYGLFYLLGNGLRVENLHIRHAASGNTSGSYLMKITGGKGPDTLNNLEFRKPPIAPFSQCKGLYLDSSVVDKQIVISNCKFLDTLGIYNPLTQPRGNIYMHNNVIYGTFKFGHDSRIEWNYLKPTFSGDAEIQQWGNNDTVRYNFIDASLSGGEVIGSDDNQTGCNGTIFANNIITPIDHNTIIDGFRNSRIDSSIYVTKTAGNCFYIHSNGVQDSCYNVTFSNNTLRDTGSQYALYATTTSNGNDSMLFIYNVNTGACAYQLSSTKDTRFVQEKSIFSRQVPPMDNMVVRTDTMHIVPLTLSFRDSIPRYQWPICKTGNRAIRDAATEAWYGPYGSLIRKIDTSGLLATSVNVIDSLNFNYRWANETSDFTDFWFLGDTAHIGVLFSTDKSTWTLKGTSAQIRGGQRATIACTGLTSGVKQYYVPMVLMSNGMLDTNFLDMDSVITPSSGPSITAQPASVSLPRNTSAAFSVTATGTGTLHYQWAKKLQAGAFGNVGTDAASYSYTATTDFDSVKVTVTDDGGSLVSSTVYTHIYPQYTTTMTNSTPAGTLSPANGTVLDSNTAQVLSYTAPAHYKKDPYTGTVGVHFNADSTTYYLTANGTITAVCHDIRKTLTVTTVGSGTSTGAGTYDSATSGIAISNSATAGWGWKGPWTKTGGITIANANANPTTITITTDGEVTGIDTATFVYSNITVAAIGGGSTTPSGAQSVRCLTNLNIAATDAAGHHFTEWKYSANISVASPTSASTTCATTDSAAGTVTAWFDTTRYTLTMAMTAGGAISPAVGAHTYDSAATVPIVGSNPKTWYSWLKWTRSTTSAVVSDTSLESTSLVLKANATVTGNWTLLTAATPTLYLPTNGDTGKSKSQTIYWRKAAADSFYIVDMDTGAAFSSALLTHDTTTDTSKAKSLTLDTATYSWRVKGGNSGGISAASSAWTFKTARASGSAGNVIIGGILGIGIMIGLGQFRRRR